MILSIGGIAIANVACDDGAGAPTAISAYEPPTSYLGIDGYFHYVDAPRWTFDTLSSVAFDTDTPEGAVLAFYASRIRGDEAWRDTLAPAGHADPFIDIVLDYLDTWRFNAIQLTSKRSGPDGVIVYIILEGVDENGDAFDRELNVDVARLDDDQFYVRTPATGVDEHPDNN